MNRSIRLPIFGASNTFNSMLRILASKLSFLCATGHCLLCSVVHKSIHAVAECSMFGTSRDFFGIPCSMVQALLSIDHLFV